MTQIPSTWVAGNYGVPDVCSRHGLPAAERRKLTIVSRPPGWSYILLVLGVLPFLIASMAVRKTVKAPAWPFCAQCNQLKTRLLLIGFGLIGLSVVVFIASQLVAAGETGARGAIGAFGCLVTFLLLIAGLIVAARGAGPAVASAQVTQDGIWVQVTKDHPAFAARVAAALAAAQPPRPGTY